MRREIGGPVPDTGAVQERQVIVPVLIMHGVIARPVGALQVAFPGLMRTRDQIRDIGRVNRIVRVYLERIGWRQAKCAAAGQGQIVSVARMRFCVQIGQQAGFGPATALS
jgi:hypothetical protein